MNPSPGEESLADEGGRPPLRSLGNSRKEEAAGWLRRFGERRERPGEALDLLEERLGSPRKPPLGEREVLAIAALSLRSQESEEARRRRHDLGFDRILSEREVSKAMGLLDGSSFELGGDRLAEDPGVLELAENVLKRLHLFHQRAGFGHGGRNRLEKIAESLGLDACSMELLAVLRSGDRIETVLQPSGTLGDETPCRRNEALVGIEAKPQPREGFFQGFPERVELLTKDLRPRGLAPPSPEPLEEVCGAGAGPGLELRSSLRQPRHLDLQVAGGVRRGRESPESPPELLLGGAFQVAPVGPDHASKPPEGDAEIVKSLLVVFLLEASEGGVRLLEETQAQVPYRLFGRPRQKTRGELDHGIERDPRIIAGPKTA